MFQNKKLKRNTTSATAEVAEVALCASNCALPTSDIYGITSIIQHESFVNKIYKKL